MCDHKPYREKDTSLVCSKCYFVLEECESVFEWVANVCVTYPTVYLRTQYYDLLLPAWRDGVHKKRRKNLDHDIINHIKDNRQPMSWKEIFEMYKKIYRLGTTNIFLIHCNVLGIWVDWLPCDKQMLKYLDYMFHIYKDEFKWTVKYQLNMWYLVYKIIQLRYGIVELVPLKLMPGTIKRLEIKWKQICNYENWLFMPYEEYKFTGNVSAIRYTPSRQRALAKQVW